MVFSSPYCSKQCNELVTLKIEKGSRLFFGSSKWGQQTSHNVTENGDISAKVDSVGTIHNYPEPQRLIE